MLVAVHTVPWTEMGWGQARSHMKVTNHSWVPGAYEAVVNVIQIRWWPEASPRAHSSPAAGLGRVRGSSPPFSHGHLPGPTAEPVPWFAHL